MKNWNKQFKELSQMYFLFSRYTVVVEISLLEVWKDSKEIWWGSLWHTYIVRVTVFFSDLFDGVCCWEQAAGTHELSWTVSVRLTGCSVKELLLMSLQKFRLLVQEKCILFVIPHELNTHSFYAWGTTLSFLNNHTCRYFIWKKEIQALDYWYLISTRTHW